MKLSKSLCLVIVIIKAVASYSQDCKPEGNPGELFTLLTPEKTKEYIEKYRTYFATRNETHTKSIYFTKSVFLLLDAFLQKNPDYTGINIHFAAYKWNKLENQADPNQITLFFTPAFGNKRSDYSALKVFYDNLDNKREVLRLKDYVDQIAKDKGDDIKEIKDVDAYINKLSDPEILSINHGELCPYVCDQTTSSWGKNQLSQSGLSGNGKIILDDIAFLTPDTAERYKKNYYNRYSVINMKHTESIYLPKAVFYFLGEFLKYKKEEVPGIRIYFASYNSFLLESQEVRKQITLIFTATDKQKEPLFCELINYYNEVYKKKQHIFNINHGELCPYQCWPPQ
jgi:hypothetical protein